MRLLLGVLGFLVVMFALSWFSGWLDALELPRRGGARVPFRYRAAPLLVNSSEVAAWRLLDDLRPGGCTVCPKVRLEDIADAAAEGRARKALRGYTKSRHVDFLLVDAQWKPLLVVEVDGRSHDSVNRQHQDDFKDRILAAAGVPVLRLRVGTDWRAQFEAWCHGRGLDAPAVRAHPLRALQR